MLITLPLVAAALLSFRAGGDTLPKKTVVARATVAHAAVAHSGAARNAGGPALPARFGASHARHGIVADSVVVEKSRRTLTLYDQGTPVRIYFVALGAHPQGAKTSLGDGRTPEGIYHIVSHNPSSKYHLSLGISYPNADDQQRARARHVQTGGDIMIHGLPAQFAAYGAAHRQWDWTEGCIAVTNAEIEEIWSAIPDGAVIQIKP